MRKILVATALALAAPVIGCSKSDTAEAGPGTKAEIPSMTVDEVDRALTAKTVTPADCNHEQLRKKLGVVPGAILISETDSFPASMLPADKTTKLVFYCADPG